jgi:hypothetical protein
MKKGNQNSCFALKAHNILNPSLQTPSASFALQLNHSLVDSLLTFNNCLCSALPMGIAPTDY